MAEPAEFLVTGAWGGDGGGGAGGEFLHPPGPVDGELINENLSISMGDFMAILEEPSTGPAPIQDHSQMDHASEVGLESDGTVQDHALRGLEELPGCPCSEDGDDQAEEKIVYADDITHTYRFANAEFYEDSVTGNISDPQLVMNGWNSDVPVGVDGVSLQHVQDSVCPIDFMNNQQVELPMNGEALLDTDSLAVEPHANCGNFYVQNDLTGSSYTDLTERSGLSEVNYGGVGSEMQNNIYPSVSVFSNNYNATELDTFNSIEEADMFYAAYNNLSNANGESALVNVAGCNQLQTGQYLPDGIGSECVMTDLAGSPESVSHDQSDSENYYMSDPSSTNSSPLPSSRNSTSEDVDRYADDSALHIKSSTSSSTKVDTDLYMLEDGRNPAQYPPFSGQMRHQPICQPPVYSEHFVPWMAGCNPRSHDERLTLQLALQDLSQPKTEANPPEGVLAVPLLRHQRIALSWMVQKETSGLHCSGGILADDQGLGKTVSTIALILTERSPSSQFLAIKQEKCEALTLDDDEEDDDVDDCVEPQLVKKPCVSGSDKSSRVKEHSVVEVKTRPAAGTLVVCPTSVLQQWAGELKNKVTNKAKLSVLVYHGSSRTKDPFELAKYDVVLTTYCIVSMEVPKQSNLDEDEEDGGNPDVYGANQGGHFTQPSKLPNSTSKKRKNNKNKESSSTEAEAKPLARVNWFRIILDEAQSIKNYRTQSARACWGLRAKRRWCLSGTPIQNTIDDLYSYFRFLKYDPYASHKSFVSMLKVPINRNPVNGYKKLQAVLKTVMLRRTKDTTIEGKPIITLPKKTVTLRRVDFTQKERSFYSILESESREQFKVYADAGTVKQNYVNILLLLLRLRQACNHPLLVKGYESSSSWRSSIEMAKQLPREKQQHLLSFLESCSAICTLCNDAPEDAVVTICGHVFCNQCICEHLSVDDTLCPVSKCTARLNASSLFSRGTLQCSLNELIASDGPSSDSTLHIVHAEKLSGINMSYESSKVKAALQILLSLPQLDSHSSSGCKKLDEKFDPVYSSEQKSSSTNGYSGKATEKAIVFSQWTRMLDLMEVHLKSSPVKYRRLDGTMSVAAREKAIKDFNTNPEVTVMIMSLKAASLGLNMVAACHVLLLDLWWNPTTEDQAIDRAHRIGQTRPVTVFRLTVKDTVEDRILALQERKREMVASAFGEHKSGSRNSQLTVQDLNYLFMV